MESQDSKILLYLRQKALLDQFLASGAITQAQYDKSFGDLTQKMGMEAFKDAGPEVLQEYEKRVSEN